MPDERKRENAFMLVAEISYSARERRDFSRKASLHKSQKDVDMRARAPAVAFPSLRSPSFVLLVIGHQCRVGSDAKNRNQVTGAVDTKRHTMSRALRRKLNKGNFLVSRSVYS